MLDESDSQFIDL